MINRVLPAAGPGRVLAVGTFVNSFGGGMFTASSALYFTRVVRLSADQVAFGLFMGSAVGLLAGVLAGRVADRYGPKQTQLVVMIFGAVSMSGYLLVRTIVPFVVVCVCIGLTFAADQASRAPLVRGLGGDQQAAFRAYLRSVTNLALALGTLVAGVGVQLDTPAAYRGLIVVRVAAFLGCALVLSLLPRLAPVRTPETTPATPPGPARGWRWAALRDRTYLTATALNCLMSVHFAVPTFLLPLWIVDHTRAPRWLVAGLLLVNMLLIVACQVPVSRGVDNQRAAGQRMRWAGVALFAGLVLMALAGGHGAPAAAGLLAAGMIAYTFGELWHSAAEMEWMFGLAPAHAQGEYAGVFGIGVGVGEAVGPMLVGVCLYWGLPGWLLVGVGVLAVGLLSPPLVARVSRSAAGEPAAVPVP